MSLLQSYIFRQAMWPLLVSVAALSVLALLTQSLATLELIVQNRQSAATFFWITVLALPQLISIILPMAILLASLYSLNRLNTDSELVVARATGVGPWQIANPFLRLAMIAAVAHLIINLFIQPAAFREMRQNILEVRMDLTSRMVLPGEFARPTPELTIYGQDIDADGRIQNLLIHDERDAGAPVTYVAEQGLLSRTDMVARLTLFDGSIQTRVGRTELDFIEFKQHQVDLDDIVAEDTVLRLKESDLYLHELMFPSISNLRRADSFAAEAHSRLSMPLYSPAMVLLAVMFLAVGKHQRQGYGAAIAGAALAGFVLRLAGFSIASAAESAPVLNILQYVIPLGVIFVCLAAVIALQRESRHVEATA